MATKKKTTTKDDFQTQLADLRRQLLGVKLNLAAGKEKNTNAARPLKKQIAKLLTQNTKK